MTKIKPWLKKVNLFSSDRSSRSYDQAEATPTFCNFHSDCGTVPQQLLQITTTGSGQLRAASAMDVPHRWSNNISWSAPTPLGCANSILILNDKVHFWLASLNCTNVLVHGVTTVLICICIRCMFCGCAFLFERHWVHPHLMAKLEQVQNLNQILHWKILTINFHILDRTLLIRQAPLRKKRQNKVTLSP